MSNIFCFNGVIWIPLIEGIERVSVTMIRRLMLFGELICLFFLRTLGIAESTLTYLLTP